MAPIIAFSRRESYHPGVKYRLRRRNGTKKGAFPGKSRRRRLGKGERAGGFLNFR